MPKFINKPVEVKCGPRNLPRALLWQDRWLPVTRILEIWKDTGIWWEDESEKSFYRLEAAGDGLFELYRESTGGWFLYRIYD